MNRIHVISGTTSGIGAAIAKHLIANGDEVIPMVRKKLDAMNMGARRYIVCDFERPDQVRPAFDELDVEIDSFINAAGVAIGQPIWGTDPEDALSLIKINLISPMLACGALKTKIRTGGSFILFSSQSAYRGGWDDIYNASKGGINSFIKSFAIKVAPNIRVIGIAPGITENTRMTLGRKADDLGKIRETIPMKRFANVDEISKLTLALLGDAGGYMTGCVVDMNGGNYLR